MNELDLILFDKLNKTLIKIEEVVEDAAINPKLKKKRLESIFEDITNFLNSFYRPIVTFIYDLKGSFKYDDEDYEIYFIENFDLFNILEKTIAVKMMEVDYKISYLGNNKNEKIEFWYNKFKSLL